MSEVKNEGLEVVAWLCSWAACSYGGVHAGLSETSLDGLRRERGDDIQIITDEPLCRHSEALAGYAVRDARIAELEDDLKCAHSMLVEVSRAGMALRAELAAIKAQEPVTEVSEETFSSDGTSDIITHNLPIGTKLYAAPVAKQVVMPDRVAMAKALCKHHAEQCGVNADDQWKVYSENFFEDVDVMLAAAPVPDAGELERLVTEHVKHAYYERKTITEAVGEIVSALQASAMAKMEGADRYTCIGKGGIYARVGTSLGAGECRGEIIEVYRDAENGQLYHRESGDFFARMLAASPPAKGGE